MSNDVQLTDVEIAKLCVQMCERGEYPPIAWSRMVAGAFLAAQAKRKSSTLTERIQVAANTLSRYPEISKPTQAALLVDAADCALLLDYLMN